MASEKQIAANRQNAKLSTGPRTAEGKARAARNALRDGFYSRAVVIPTGLDSEFQRLRQELLNSFQPDGEAQDVIFDEILIASWNIRRAAIAEKDIFNRQGDPTLDPLADDANESRYRRLRQFARQAQISRDRAIKLLSDLQTEVRARLQAFPPDTTVETHPGDQKPHSFSLLCRLKDVVKAMKSTKGYKSAPLSERNEANSSLHPLPQAVEFAPQVIRN